MSGPPPSIPRFRLVAGRGIGERERPIPAVVRSPQPAEVRVAQEEQNLNVVCF